MEIPGFEGYFITNDGRIYSKKSKKFLLPQSRGKYKEVTLYSRDSKRKYKKQYKIHYLVALAYIPNPKNLPKVKHIDGSGDPLDNSPNNLEWCTRKENIDHARKTGLIKPHTKSVCQADLNGKLLKTYPSIVEAAKDNNIDPRGIGNVCKKRRNTCGGWYWYYKREIEDWKPPISKSVIQTTKEGKYIASYPSIKKASEVMGISKNSISKVLDPKTRNKTAGGFFWSFKEN